MQNAVKWELESKFKNREVQEDSESEIILKVCNVNFMKLQQILFVWHVNCHYLKYELFSWWKYTLT